MEEYYNILYEDDDLLVINKFANVLSIPDRWNPDIPNLRSLLDERYGKIFVVHRLDKETSGIMIFAKNAETHKYLNDLFEHHKIRKLYHVVVSGILQRNEVDVDIPIMTDPSNKGRSIPSSRGKESLTKIKVLQRFKVATLIECDLISGRHHQIRVHCSAIGHPLLVDTMYGDKSEFYLSSIKRKFNLKKGTEERPIIDRITMHASSLQFAHPRHGEELTFTADHPKDFAALLQLLGKYSQIPDYLSNRANFE
jgi:23S rRNA pseudouridine1911/1915/1917 synthase